jgi:hypothetical protein
MKKHVELLGILLITYSALGFVVAIGASMLLSGAGLLAFVTDNVEGALAHTILGAVSVFLMTAAFVVCVPGIIAGVGLFKLRNWARILTLIISVLNMLRIPIGTALSIYAFWVLMKEETIQMFKAKPQA